MEHITAVRNCGRHAMLFETISCRNRAVRTHKHYCTYTHQNTAGTAQSLTRWFCRQRATVR